jgi:hypothetical protein
MYFAEGLRVKSDGAENQTPGIEECSICQALKLRTW